jgi:hypothetical protein
MSNFKDTWKNRIKDLQKSFYDSEMILQDKALTPKELNSLTEQQNLLNFNKDKGESFQNVINKLRNALGPNPTVELQNTYLNDQTPQEFASFRTIEEQGNLFPIFMQKLGKRMYKFGEQYVDNIPGLSSFSTENNPDMGTAGALIQAGGRVLPLAGAAMMVLNAGPTAAGTLEEARKKGF